MMKSAVRVVLSLCAGWLAWLWFIDLWAAGEAAIGTAVPEMQIALIWGTLGLAGAVMFIVGAMSRSFPWGLCLLAASYPAWRMASAYSQNRTTALLWGAALVLLFAVASAVGTMSKRLGLRKTRGDAH